MKLNLCNLVVNIAMNIVLILTRITIVIMIMSYSHDGEFRMNMAFWFLVVFIQGFAWGAMFAEWRIKKEQIANER